ncbi:hypothetical protein [Rubritalea tangerina]|uniref:Lipoprotein n=1 Tax=Rubritalea tangerina TaxID=430798 RepID=A0ABW4Z862_9BACT
MKFKHLFFALATLSSAVLVSCDGSSSEEPNVASKDAERAESLLAEEFSQDDNIRFITSDNTPAQPSLLVMDGNGEATVGLSTYIYSKNGKYGFSIIRRAGASPQATLTQALDNTLTDNGTNAQLGSRLRLLLRRDNPVFSAEELSEIAGILNPSGTQFRLSSDGSTLIATVDESRSCIVTSNFGDQVRGAMAGVYSVQINGFTVTYRAPDAGELARYRFLTADTWIPQISGVSVPAQVIEQGTFNIELVNRAQ